VSRVYPGERTHVSVGIRPLLVILAMQRRAYARAWQTRDVRVRIGRYHCDLDIGEYAKRSARDLPRWYVRREGRLLRAAPLLEGRTNRRYKRCTCPCSCLDTMSNASSARKRELWSRDGMQKRRARRNEQFCRENS